MDALAQTLLLPLDGAGAPRGPRSTERAPPSRRPTIADIRRTTCRRFGLTDEQLISDRRSLSIARPRQIAMYLSATMTRHSLPAIGACLGGRDHRTVSHGIKMIERLMATDPGMAAVIEELTQELSLGNPPSLTIEQRWASWRAAAARLWKRWGFRLG